MTTDVSNTTASNQKSYFDLHTTGIGYVQRVREVPVKGGRKAQPFLACTIAALVGPAKESVYRYFDVKVSGAEAKKLVQPYVGVDDPKQRPLVRFRLGDLWVDPFIRPKGDQKGKPAASLKARLLKAQLMDRAELADIGQYELITRGIGYLNRIKEVTPRDGDPFLSCSIAALSGPIDDPDYRYVETIVTDANARHLVRRCVQAVEAEKKVLIAFRLSDMQADPYIRTKGEKAGEAAATLESKLIHVGLIKVDGERVYPLKSEGAASENASASPETGTQDDGGINPTTEPATREPEASVDEPALAA